ncbi:MAG: 16S rRNA (guanine(527)-N(7))-methyltransferase RsmG [Lachnospiraceae bacterium]|nr:16S rRNA (guanine(527)-N(7))-methyltransferase RsmG [Lachnospiraceae bacterium]
MSNQMSTGEELLERYDVSLLEQRFLDLGITLTQEQKIQFLLYYEYLLEKNQVMNLTAITEYEEVVEKHFADSLAAAAVYELGKADSVIDVGTGAGFPGIPLKIVYPHLKIVLLDSLNKRVQFLNEVISLLHLEDAQAVHGRAEDYAKKEEYREQFDLCVSRAVANLSTLSEYCIPFIKIDGLFISYKSTKIDEEVKKAGTAISLLGGRIEEKKALILPGSDIPRSFILIRKERPTPAKFPRKAGLPSKEPLSEKTKPDGKKGKKEKA